MDSTDIVYICGGIALFGASMYLVNRFDLQRRGIFAPLFSNEGKRLPALGAILLGIGGGVLVYLGLRG